MHNESRKTRTKASIEEPTIVIERRQIVAVIQSDPYGEHPPLQTAFMAAADAFTESITDHRSSDRLEFTYGGHRFTFGADPVATNDTEATD